MYPKIIIGSLLCASVIFSGCENKKPNTVWDPNPDEKPQPVIQHVEPAVSAYAGIQVIILTGWNFSPIPAENMITVQGQPGIILTASDTEITAIPPLIIGDSVSLRLDVIGSYYSGEFQPYRLISPVNVYGNFAENEFVQDIEFDKDGNLYALITNSAGDKIVYKQTAGDTVRNEYGRVSFLIGPPSMKFGQDGSLFICRKNNKKFYRIPPGGGSTELYERLPGRVQTFDFDPEGNIYIGGSGNEIYHILRDKTIHTVADYDTIDIISLRIYENYVYVAGQYEEQTSEGLNIYQKIWRNPINSSIDTLGQKELVFDWTDFNSGYLISAITFSDNGDLYISSDADDPITIVHPDNRTSVFLEGIMPTPAVGLTWDEGEFFYYINEVDVPYRKQIIRVYTGKQSAVYNGRQ